MKMIVIVGVAGAGKSTLARLLKAHRYEVVEALEYALKHDSYLAYDVVRKSLVVDPAGFKDVKILVSTFIPEAEEVHCILVEAPKEIIRKRLLRRGYSEEKIEENIEALEILRLEVEEYCSDYIVVDGTKVENELEKVLQFLERFL